MDITNIKQKLDLPKATLPAMGVKDVIKFRSKFYNKTLKAAILEDYTWVEARIKLGKIKLDSYATSVFNKAAENKVVVKRKYSPRKSKSEKPEIIKFIAPAPKVESVENEIEHVHIEEHMMSVTTKPKRNILQKIFQFFL